MVNSVEPTSNTTNSQGEPTNYFSHTMRGDPSALFLRNTKKAGTSSRKPLPKLHTYIKDL